MDREHLVDSTVVSTSRTLVSVSSQNRCLSRLTLMTRGIAMIGMAMPSPSQARAVGTAFSSGLSLAGFEGGAQPRQESAGPQVGGLLQRLLRGLAHPTRSSVIG